jgi:hypothetical protein
MGDRLAEALRAACHPRPGVDTSVCPMAVGGLSWMVDVPAVAGTDLAVAATAIPDVDRLLVDLFTREGGPLVRLARLFVDDRNAAEDLVQEAFIRLARSAQRIKDETRGGGLPALDRPEPGTRPQPPRPGIAAAPAPARRTTRPGGGRAGAS